jgi:hypothetical protein
MKKKEKIGINISILFFEAWQHKKKLNKKN